MSRARTARPRALAGLLAWAALLPACATEPLSGPLAPQAVSPRAFELLVPPAGLPALGQTLLGEWLAAGGGALVVGLPLMQGVLGADEADYSLAAVELRVPLVELELAALGEHLSGAARLAPLDAILSLELQPVQGPARTCGLHLQGEPGEFTASWTLQPDPEGRPTLAPLAPVALDGAPLEIWLDPGCTVLPTEELVAELAAAVEAALQAGLDALVEQLGAELARAVGLRLELQGCLEGFRFALRSSASASAIADGAVRVGLEGGFEGPPAACVPADLEAPAPGDGQPTAISLRLPGSGQAYGLAVSVPLASLQQGLRAVHRAGLLCRRAAGESPLPGLRLEDLLPSLPSLGDLRGTRVAIWPEGPPEVSLEVPSGEERLPRVVVRLPSVGVDVYADMDGADVRALGCVAEIFLTLSPEWQADGLHVHLVGTRVGNLLVTFELLPAESGPELRAAAATLLTELAEVLVGGLGPLALEPPAPGRGEVLEAWSDGRALTVYLAP